MKLIADVIMRWNVKSSATLDEGPIHGTLLHGAES